MTQARIKAPQALSPGATPVRHRTPSSRHALAPLIPTLTTMERRWDRPWAPFSAVSARLVALRAGKATGNGGTTSQAVTHLALLARRAADGVFWNEGGARKSKLALTQ